MIVKSIKEIENVHIIQKEIRYDNMNSRIITYSWNKLFNQGIPTLFRYIYRFEYTIKDQLDGMRLSSNNEFYISSVLGTVEVYLFDLRIDSKTYLNKFNVTLSPDNNFQRIYIPQNIAWGIQNLTDISVLNIASKELLSDGNDSYIIDPLDPDMDMKIEGEFSIKKYENYYSMADIKCIICTDKQQQNDEEKTTGEDEVL